MASIAVLPILIGLAVDYAIQFQARFDEAVADGLTGTRPPEPRPPTAAPRSPPPVSPPPPASSPSSSPYADGPQLRPAAPDRHRPRFPPRTHRWIRGPQLCRLAGAVSRLRPRGGSENGASARRTLPLRGPALAPVTSPARPASPGARRRPRPGRDRLGRRHPDRDRSDIRSLAPQNLAAVEDLNDLQDTTGVSGQLDVSVEAPDLTDPATIAWMAGFKQRVLAKTASAAKTRAASRPTSVPDPALSDFLTRGGGRADPRRASTRRWRRSRPTPCGRSRRSIQRPAGRAPGAALLRDPRPVAGGSAGADRPGPRRDRRARLAGGAAGRGRGAAGRPPGDRRRIRRRPLRQPLLADACRPAGGRSGAARSSTARSRRALVPLVPTLLATGWASLVLWLTGIPLNPMSAALGALTIAIATEFGVILAGRFHEERRGGHGVEEALRRPMAAPAPRCSPPGRPRSPASRC